MTKSSKTILSISIITLIILIITCIFLLGDKKLDLNSQEVKNLYSYLGSENIYLCGGLNVYNTETTTLKDLNKDNTLCMAFYSLKDLKQEKIKSNKTNKTKDKICEVGNNIKFVADNKDTCSYKTLTKEELNKNYRAIYGSNIKKYNNFAISNTETCYLDEEIYYCGEGETYTYALSGEATIYRLIDKAIKQLNGDVTIYDYFLKISDNKCYTSNNNLENSDCTKALKKQKEIDESFIKKYGKIYKHSYKKDKDITYWTKSELKDK